MESEKWKKQKGNEFYKHVRRVVKQFETENRD